ncbi:MAG: VanW family protein [Actinomycetes bacterium]
MGRGTADGARRATLRHRWPWVVGGALVLAVAGYTAAAWAVGEHVPAGTRVGGVDIGGQSRGQAVDTLRRELAPRLAEPFPVTVDGAKDTVDPAAAGLTGDLPATVDRLVGFSVDPRSLWRHLVGRSTADVVTHVDEAKLSGAVRDLAGRVDTPAVEGAVSFADGAAVPTAAANGRQLDSKKAAEVVADEWPAGRPIQLPATVVEPTVDQAAVDEAMSSFAQPAMAGPLVVVVGQTRTEVPPAGVAPALAMQPQDAALKPAVDGEALKKAVLAVNPALDAKPRNARIVVQNGAPVVVPAVNGVTIDAAALGEKALAALPTPERTVTLDAAVAEPELTTAEAQGLGVKQVVSEFATNLTADAGRTENIQIASRTVNGTLLLPGQTFSLNGVLGRRTAAKGYNEAPVIMNGRLTTDYGGGVSQVATTLFNGMFFAGLEDVDHKPHSFYISRYPEGREATVNYPTVDLKFKNDSPHGVLIEMWTGGGQVHTRFWGTKVWDVTALKGERTNIRQPTTIVDNSPGCVPQLPSPGFDVKVTRVFSQGGAEKKRETFSTRYIAEDQVTCTR